MTKEQSEELAEQILALGGLVLMIDPVYAEECYEKMKANLSHREAMTILAPNPFTELPKQELNKAKIEHLRLIVELRKNFEVIRAAEINVQNAEVNSNSLASIFF